MPIDKEILTRLEALEKSFGKHLGPKPGESTIKVSHPGTTLTARDSLPTPSPELSYKLIILRGTDSTPDRIYICMRDASQVWAWRPLNDTAIPGASGRYGGG
ncbi:hypothetical protein LCGC14_1541500 [marine sediment metagenome]|uniref:Uncharacterized protein n=1 Tax=marine sediment metagenome TaxID=412755 RepID=A0A0F9JDV7_9ZZZZ